MRGAWTIAVYTFREMGRNYYWITLAILCAVCAFSFATMSSGGEALRALTFTSFLSRIFLWLAAIYMGMTLPTTEIRDLRIRLLFTRPISNAAYVTGKYLAGLIYLTLLAVCFGLIMYILALVQKLGNYPPGLYYPIHLVPLFSCHMALVMAVALAVPPRPVVGFVAILAFLDTYFQMAKESFRLSHKFYAKFLLYPIFFFVTAVIPPNEKYMLTYKELAEADFMFGAYGWFLLYAVAYAALAVLIGAASLDRKEL